MAPQDSMLMLHPPSMLHGYPSSYPTEVGTHDDDYESDQFRYQYISRRRPHHRPWMYRIVVDVPDLDASDITIRIEHHERILHIIGERDHKRIVDNRYRIDLQADTNQVVAVLLDGVLYVTAPSKKTTTINNSNERYII